MTHVNRLDNLALRRRLAVVVCLSGVLAAGWLGLQRADTSSGRRAFDRVIPLLAQGAVSRTLGHDVPRFLAAPVPGGFRVRNAGFTARFGRGGVAVGSSRGGWFALSLRAVGYPGAMVALGSVAARARANVVTFGHGFVSEWYANGPLGLEQGFSIVRRVAGARSGALTLALGLAGSLRASLDRSGVKLGSGANALRYTMPVASDATGRTLPAWLELRDRSLLVRVNDRGARYPVRIDPFVRAATLRASDAVHGSFGLHFGDAVDASGDVIAVGAPDARTGAGGPEGAVYVFTRPASGWADATETAKLTASDGAANDQLGTSVAISGDTIVAGAPGAIVADHNVQGALYVFTRSATGWVGGTETAKLTASDGAADDALGRSVAIEGDTIVAGAPGAQVGANAHEGAVYAFTRPPSGWRNASEAAKLTASDGGANGGLGDSVAISGPTAVASGDDAEYVFGQPQGGWSGRVGEQAKLTVAGAILDEVVIDGATIAAESIQPGGVAGPVEVFVRPDGGWANVAPSAQLRPSNGRVGDGFGMSIAIRGTRILVGAPLESPAGMFEAGAAYVYDEPSSGWRSETESAVLTEPTPAQGDFFGDAVAIVDDGTVLAGAPFSTFGGVQQGLAYVFAGSAAPPGPGGTTTSTPPTTVPPTPTTTSPPPPAPPPATTGCLVGYDAKYPDFPQGLGVGPDYDLTDPSTQADGVVEQTLAFGRSSLDRGMYVTTGGCFSLQRQVPGKSLSGYSQHQEFATYGDVNLDGVILVAVNARHGTAGPAQLHVGTDGTIYATGADTRYSVAVTSANGTRVIVGRADLGSTPWHWDGGLRSLIGQFGRAPDAPCPFGRPLVGGAVTATGVGQAAVTAYVQLPALFSSTPDGGPAPTAQLSYGPFTNPNVPATTTGGGGGGGGGGGMLGAGGCDPQTRAHCTRNLAAGDGAVAACAGGTAPTGGGGGSGGPAGGAGGDGGSAGGAGGPAGGSGAPLHLTVPELFLGPLRLSDVFLDYDPASGVWSGGGDAQIGEFELRAAPPPPDNGLGLRGDGSFDHGGASLSAPGGVPLFPGVEVTELGVTFALDPVRLSGDATLSVAGGLATVHGAVLVVFANRTHPYTYQPLALPGLEQLQTDTRRNPITSTAIGVAGTVGLRLPVIGETDLANGYVFYIAPSYFEFAGRFTLGVLGLSIDGNVSGALDTATRRFSLAGGLEICADFPDPVGHQCLGADGALSSAGFGACGHVSVIHTFDVGFRYLFSGGLTIFLDGCDLGPVQIDVRAAHDASARAAGAPGFTLPPGLPSASVTVTGAGGPPRVTIAGPHGERASSDPGGRLVDTGRIVILPMRDRNETLIGIEHPAGGRWTVSPEPGSPAISGVSHADGLPPARVTATVHGHGRRWRLAYRLRPRAGQSVTFAERAGQVFHVLGDARGARGALSFAPAGARTRHRQIVALISLAGVPRQTLVAGHYLAPAPVRPGAPRHVRITRRGNLLRVAWSAATNAHAYAVTVAVSDGQRLALFAGRAHRTVAVNAPAPGLGASVTVQAIGADGTSGPPRSGHLAPAAGPSRVRGITAIRTHAGVAIRWRPVRGAARYLVEIVVSGAGGPAYAEVTTLPRLRPSVDLARLRRGRTATITVRAMSAEARLGPAGSVVYRPSKHKPT